MRIGIVNDLAMAVEAIRRVLKSASQHRIAWVASNGVEAVELCARDRPDLILMDLIMPVMDGVEATRRIMSATPCPILVVTATVEGNASRVFDAMGVGALDAVNTPILDFGSKNNDVNGLLLKIDTIGRLMDDRIERPFLPAQGRVASITSRRNPLVAIGASAGGPAALATLLAGLPGSFPAAVIIIQHVDAQFAEGMAAWLSQQGELAVRLARNGEKPSPGMVLIAGTNDHLALVGPQRLGYVPEPRDYAYRPSVDVFYESVAKNWSGDVVGVLLTGMGRDGAKGLKSLRECGHHTIAQDQATSAVYGMPKAAVALGAAVEILPLDKIAPCLKKRFVPSIHRSIQL